MKHLTPIKFKNPPKPKNPNQMVCNTKPSKKRDKTRRIFNKIKIHVSKTV